MARCAPSTLICLATNDTAGYSRALLALNPKTARESVSLAKLNREGATETKDAIAVALMMTLSQLNITNTMDEVQIGLAIPLLLKQFYYLRFDEVLLCFRMALSGRWGKNFNRIDIDIISGWLTAYDDTIRTPLVTLEADHEYELLKAGKSGAGLNEAQLVELGYVPLNAETEALVERQRREAEAEADRAAPAPPEMLRQADEMIAEAARRREEEAARMEAGRKHASYFNESEYQQHLQATVGELTDQQLAELEQDAWQSRNKALLDEIEAVRLKRAASAA